MTRTGCIPPRTSIGSTLGGGSSAVSECGRVLPTPPSSPRGTASYQVSAPTPPLTSGVGVGGSGGVVPRISQSLEVNTSRDQGMEDTVPRQSSVTEGETIRIVIHDVDLDHRKASGQEKGRRRVKIQRDLSDTGHR
ncbi:hypothetical protein C7M84_006227, partial [Penaeus vannamei]